MLQSSLSKWIKMADHLLKLILKLHITKIIKMGSVHASQKLKKVSYTQRKKNWIIKVHDKSYNMKRKMWSFLNFRRWVGILLHCAFSHRMLCKWLFDGKESSSTWSHMADLFKFPCPSTNITCALAQDMMHSVHLRSICWILTETKTHISTLLFTLEKKTFFPSVFLSFPWKFCE